MIGSLGCTLAVLTVMVLEVQTNSREVNKRLDACSTKFLGVTCTEVSLEVEAWKLKPRNVPMPERCRINGELNVPPLTT
jgi:hypothetical protein